MRIMVDNRFGPKPREDEYKIHRGKPVRVINSNGDSSLGILDSYSTEYLNLKPSLVNHGFYTIEDKLKHNPRIIQDRPTKVKIALIAKIDPLEEGYFEALAQNLYQISHPFKIILPK